MGADRSAILSTMSLLRTAARFPSLVRHCTKAAAISQQQTRNYGDMAFTFASTDQVFYNGASVKQIDVPSFSGSFGILPDHVPLLAVLKPGVVTVLEDDASTKILCEQRIHHDQRRLIRTNPGRGSRPCRAT